MGSAKGELKLWSAQNWGVKVIRSRGVGKNGFQKERWGDQSWPTEYKGGGTIDTWLPINYQWGRGHKNIIKPCGGVRAEADKFCRDTTKNPPIPTLSPPTNNYWSLKMSSLPVPWKCTYYQFFDWIFSFYYQKEGNLSRYVITECILLPFLGTMCG